MAYTLVLTETSEKEIRKKLEAHLVDRLNERLQKLEQEPKAYGKPLRAPLSGIWEI